VRAAHSRVQTLRTVLPVLLGILACRGRVPDVAPLQPIQRADGRVVELLLDVDALAERDPDAAARSLRETVAPRADANAAAATRVTVTEPRAQRLHAELVRLTRERSETVQLYARALESRDADVLRQALRRQVQLDRSMDRFEAAVQAAQRAQRVGGCSR